ncbi:MAG: tetratricopeptide repeat protein [Acetobacteraceae bacterium]
MSATALATSAEYLAAVQAHLGANDLTGALRVAEQAAACHPRDLACQLQLGSILEQAGRRADAAAHYRVVWTQHPDNPWVAARLAAALARVGRGEEALALYHAAIADAPMTEAERTQIARQIAAPLRRNKDAAALLAARVPVTPDDAALLREAGSAAASTERLADAVDYLDRSAAREALPGWAHAIRIDARSKLARRSRLWPPVDAELVAALQEALAQHPHNPAFVRFLNRLPIAREAWLRLYARVRDTVELRSKDGFLLYETMLAALQANDRRLAEALIAALAPGSEWARRAAPIADVLRRVPAAVWARSRLDDDKAAELQIVRTPGADATLLVFATLTGNFMMLPLAMLDALLADLPVHVVYLRDTTSHAPGLRGFRSFGLRVDDTIARLRQEISGLGASRLLTLGASASGLSAIRYGARLGAERATTFGALTSLGPEFGHAAIRSGRLTMSAVAEAEMRFRDVAAEMAAAPAMRVAFHYGAQYQLDVDHADRVRHLPGVTVHPAIGVDHHYVVLSLIADGTFRDAVWSDRPASPSPVISA